MDSLQTVTKWKVQVYPFHRKKMNGPVDYRTYVFSPREECVCILEGLVLTAILAYFFYRSLAAFLLLTPLVFFYRKEKKRRLAGKRSERLERQFREVLLSVNINLQAGYSIENAFLESYKDIVGLFGNSCDMARELILIRKGMANSISLERLLNDLGNRCPKGEIREFTEVFGVAVKSGGKIRDVMKKTVDIIREKAEIKEELETLIHAKQMENRIMCVVPFFILLYVNLTSPGYFDVLYRNVAGICIMTACMVLYLFAVCWADKITAITFD